MCTYDQLWNVNDQSEGKYLVSLPFDRDLKDEIKKEKKHLLVGCLTNKVMQQYMWKNFGGEGQGICIALNLKEKDIVCGKLLYYNEMLHIANSASETMTPKEIAKSILMHKLAKFSNEDETRILYSVNDDVIEDFISVKILRLYLGWNISEQEEKELRDIAKAKDIKVIKLHKPLYESTK